MLHRISCFASHNAAKLISLSVVFLIAATITISIRPKQNIKIFQIGPSKCGTTTLSTFFNANGVKSVHHDSGKLAESIYNNHFNNQVLLSAPYDGYIGYFDMQSINTNPPIFIPKILFKELDRQYPGSKFILNTRDKDNLLKSISAVQVGNGMNYLEATAMQFNRSQDEVLQYWLEEFNAHNKEVLEYFKDRPDDLLVFNIETDPPEKLSAFFKDYFKLDPKLYQHKNKTLN